MVLPARDTVTAKRKDRLLSSVRVGMVERIKVKQREQQKVLCTSDFIPTTVVRASLKI